MKDHVALPARVERNRKRIRQFVTLVLGGMFSLAAFSAYGTENPRPGLPAVPSSPRIVLPPIPYLDSMPWPTWTPSGQTMKIDTLFWPGQPSVIDLAPAPRDRSTQAVS